MGTLTPEATTIVDKFRCFDPDGQGLLDRTTFATAIQKLTGLSMEEVQSLIEKPGVIERHSGKIFYKRFLSWLLDGNELPIENQVSDAVAVELEDIADSLTSLAMSMDTADHGVAAALNKHASNLRLLYMSNADPPERIAAILTDCATAEHPEDVDPFARIMRNHSKPHEVSEEVLCFRQKAAEVVQETGMEGEAVDDLKEVPISEVTDRLAISYWRFCTGLSCWRSPTVTKALNLICSAPVPGLHGPSYLDVFKTLTAGSVWENHIYLFGGLVRDIIRRTVGNDIDIGFSAPADELEATCKTASFVCKRDGDYILIGDDDSDEYLEGMVISYNGIQAPEHADFAMNTLFYDFANDIIIDKTGKGIQAVLNNSCDLPCPPDRWKSWIDINGVRVCFRYYKFLLRGYTWKTEEMIFVLQTLIDFWSRQPDHTIDVGREALGGLVGSADGKKIEKLKNIVTETFEAASAKVQTAVGSRSSSKLQSKRMSMALGLAPESEMLAKGMFLAASTWWEQGWLPLLKLAT
jgi:hypothetical protein